MGNNVGSNQDYETTTWLPVKNIGSIRIIVENSDYKGKNNCNFKNKLYQKYY